MRSIRRPRTRDIRRTFLASGVSRASRTFRPWIERLEDRRVLACDTTFENGALVVLGKDSDDAVEITVGLRRVQVTCDDLDQGTFASVRSIHLELGGGDDSLRFDAEQGFGPDAIQDTDGDAVPEFVDGFGGAGADTFVISASATRLLNLDAGEDGDSVSIQFGRLFGAVRVADSGTQGTDLLQVMGTAVDESMEVIGGDSNAWMVHWDGRQLDGSGATEIAIETLEIAHEGFLTVAVDAAGGNDRVTMSDPLGLLGGIDWRLDLGEGDNTFRADLINPAGSLEVVAGRGNDFMEAIAGWDDELRSAATDFVWRPTFAPGAGHDQTLITIYTRSGSIGTLPVPQVDVELDLADGNDQAKVDAAAVVELNVVVYSGRGNDSVDLRLAALPGALQVNAGEGDDAISVVIAEDPSHPAPAPSPEERLPELRVDVGSGSNSLLMDVFGSLAAPPRDEIVIASPITLTEVLADIFVTGVGQLSLLTLFPLGALEMKQAVRDDRMGQAHDANTAVAVSLRGPDLTMNVKTGASADEISIDLTPQPESHLGINVATGAENDRINVHSHSTMAPLDLLMVVEPGEVSRFLPVTDDEVVVVFKHGDIQRPVVLGAIWNGSQPPSGGRRDTGRLSLHAAADAAKVLYDLDLLGTAGRDIVRVDVTSSQEPGDTAESIVHVLDISGSMGGGNDSFTYVEQSGPPVQTGDWILDSSLNINMGPGDDQVVALLQNSAEELSQKVRIDSGDGNDRVQVSASAALANGGADLVVGVDSSESATGFPHVKVIDGRTGTTASAFDPYGPGFTGGVRVATGDVNGDGVLDIITGAGPSAGPHVKVFDGVTGAELRSFFAYTPTFAGGVYVAAGDINGDGSAEIITGAGAGAPGGHVKVFDGRSGAEVRSFFAFDPNFIGGVNVAAGDVNGDGIADIVVGAGSSAGPHVKVFDGLTGAEVRSFDAYGPSFTGGVFVAAGDVDGDGRADIVTGAGAGAPGGHVKVFSGASGAEVHSFFAFDTSFAGGVRVATGDVNGDGRADLVVGAGPGAPGGHVKVFDGSTGQLLDSLLAFDSGFTGGVFVAAGDLNSSASQRTAKMDLAIDSGAGDDLVSVEVNAAGPGAAHQKVRISTGDGADRARVIWSKLRLRTEFPTVAADVGIDMGRGNDSAEVEIQSDDLLLNDVLSFEVRLGDGNDQARYWVFGTELPTSTSESLPAGSGQLDLRVLGGRGSDQIGGHIGSNPAGEGLPLPLGQSNLLIDGGGGRDWLSLDFQGPILNAAAVDAVIRGGGGNDQVQARIEIEPASTGRLSVQVVGDAGNDELGLAILGEKQLDEFFALLDGGKGRDKCRVTGNVLVRNCEG